MGNESRDETAAVIVFLIGVFIPFLVALTSSGFRSIGAAIVFAAAVASMESEEWRRKR